MLYKGEDNAMLRFGLGNAYFQQHDYHSAITHLEQAVTHDPGYSAAWKLLGKSFIECKDTGKARVALQNGIKAAEKKGDIQAVKEMNVFLKRLDQV
ncbi:MAG: tetratricopeptide repeat protein [Pseudomonadota bacterium]